LYIQFAFGGVIGTIKIFKKGGEWFLAIIWGGIVFVYKLIKTPFGYIYKQIATIYVPNQNDALNPNGNNVLQIEDLPPNGGNRRKTRKHKKKRTNKLNGRKKRQTKYRKGRRTKKR
jgi:hypothetical protein